MKLCLCGGVHSRVAESSLNWLAVCAGRTGDGNFYLGKSPLYYTRAFLMATPRAHPVTRSLNLGYIDRFKGTEKHGFNGKDLL